MTIQVLRKVSNKLMKATVNDYLTVLQITKSKMTNMAVVNYFFTTQACGGR